MRNSVALFFCAALLLGGSACSSDDDNTTADTTDTGETNPDPIEVSSCSSSTGMEKIICLSDAFKTQLTSSQLAAAQRTYTTSEAMKWSNFPEALYGQRVGLDFGSMTSTQIQYAKALLKEIAGTSDNEGWDELQKLLNADEYLKENGGGSDYGAANYYIAFLGTPAATGTFEIQYGGHHVAFANTYTDGVLVGATPSFRGIEPFSAFEWNGETNQPLVQEKDALSAMLTALSSDQLTSAKLASTFSDLVAGPQKDANFPTTPSGVKGGDLSSEQKDLILTAIKTYVEDVEDAEAILTKYTTELDDTYIAYSGTTGLTTTNDYVRIDGPSVWIEYSCQRGVVLSGTHPHSVWRDKLTDYGGN
ncbi:DUF3500 domain-containing protein [Chryseolinea soli]|nr:DUF3500 domain-containing protein [Chryseolinea soli]